MKTKFVLSVFLIAAFLLSACTAQPTPTAPPPTTIPPTAVPPTAIPPTAIPPTAVPPTDTPVPQESHLFRDDFDGALQEGWQWIGEDPTHWSLTNAPGFLQITVQPSNIGSEEGARNFLVRAIPEGDFQVETFLKFEPTSNFQFAGLLIYEAQGKAMQFGRAYAKCDYPPCKGNAIYFDISEPGVVNPPNFATQVTETSQAYLRLVRVGNQYSGYYSADGVAWTLIGTHTSALAPIQIGLIGSQGFEGETTADFDYFLIQQVP